MSKAQVQVPFARPSAPSDGQAGSPWAQWARGPVLMQDTSGWFPEGQCPTTCALPLSAVPEPQPQRAAAPRRQSREEAVWEGGRGGLPSLPPPGFPSVLRTAS